jgi:hypothetical protein
MEYPHELYSLSLDIDNLCEVSLLSLKSPSSMREAD